VTDLSPEAVAQMVADLRDHANKLPALWPDEAADMLTTIAAENATLRDRAYKLAVAICGGEDAPGYADSIDVETLEDMARELNRVHMENADEIDELATLRAERDEWQLEVAMCIMACPPGKRTSPASEGVKLLRASEAAALERVTRITGALVSLAALDDKLANDYLISSGSYSGFDEPHAVQTARAALTPTADKEPKT